MTERKLIGLQITTGLVVAFVRHNLQSGRIAWDSVWQFLMWWFIHTIAVTLLVVIVSVSITHLHKFFLGYEYGGFKNKSEEMTFYVLMTILVASVCIFFIANYIPSDIPSDY